MEIIVELKVTPRSDSPIAEYLLCDVVFGCEGNEFRFSQHCTGISEILIVRILGVSYLPRYCSMRILTKDSVSQLSPLQSVAMVSNLPE